MSKTPSSDFSMVGAASRRSWADRNQGENSLKWTITFFRLLCIIALQAPKGRNIIAQGNALGMVASQLNVKP